MTKLLDQIRIFNNKAYENVPEGRLRRHRGEPAKPDIPVSSGDLPRHNGNGKAMNSVNLADNEAEPQDQSVPEVPEPAHQETPAPQEQYQQPQERKQQKEYQPEKSGQKQQESSDFVTSAISVPHITTPRLVAPPNAPKRKLGRPRLFSAQVVERTDDTFKILIKFNVRNKLARRFFGITPPAPPPMEKLSRLRPPSVRKPVLGIIPDEEVLSLDRSNRKREPRQVQNISEPVQTRRSIPRSHKRYTGISTSQLPYNEMSSTQKLSSEATERLSESLEKDLPYHGALAFPECIINHTDPTALDRNLFAEFAARGSQKHIELQKQMLSGTATEDSPVATPIPQGASHYYSRSQIEKLQFREFLIDTWYSSPYPEEYASNKVLYVCEFCLKYMSSPQSYLRHQLKRCNSFKNHPPGMEIYRDPEARIAFWEVDGRKNIEYCQSLCLMAKLFLNSKTLYYDVEPFVFYILTEIDEQDSSTYHFVGYFSKEKLNNSDYNVSCILTLPIYQRKGYGSLMIDFSYLLSRREFKYGTPEKPLSDLGLVSYRNYWKIAVAHTLRKIYDDFLSNTSKHPPLTLESIAKLTGMKPSDVVFALESLDALLQNKDTGSYAISINLELLDEVISKSESRNYVKLNPEYLLWKPLIYGPSGGINSAPALTLVSQPGSQMPIVSNSISMITEFLKDDIGNPFSFEEEAYNSIESAFENSKENIPSSPSKSSEYHVCRPDLETVTRETRISETGNIKLASSDEESEEDVDNEFLDSASEEAFDVNSDVVLTDKKIRALVQDGDLVSEEEDGDEPFDSDSPSERTDVEGADEEVASDDDEEEEGEEDTEEEEEEEEAADQAIDEPEAVQSVEDGEDGHEVDEHEEENNDEIEVLQKRYYPRNTSRKTRSQIQGEVLVVHHSPRRSKRRGL
ncbi:hypothetical protein JCM33374_g473 [Metschnikowia sp. JCM 33374]|nr:hypothetical protein JCM33374_g473 [Metschnikowia sp. JCM 33374]